MADQRDDIAQQDFNRTIADFGAQVPFDTGVKYDYRTYVRGINRAYQDGLLKGLGSVPAEQHDLYNGQTAHDHGYELGLADGRSDEAVAFEEGREVGYQVGENERIALATANGEMRTSIREALALARAHEPYYAIIEALTASR